MPKTNHSIGDSDSPWVEMNEEYVEIGDTISVDSNNQMGYKKYLVVKDEDGVKGLRLLVSFKDEIYEDEPRSSSSSSQGDKKRKRSSSGKRSSSSKRSSSKGSKKQRKTSRGGKSQKNQSRKIINK